MFDKIKLSQTLMIYLFQRFKDWVLPNSDFLQHQ